jgi:isocitrate dehydrogenase (NAD+)
MVNRGTATAPAKRQSGSVTPAYSVTLLPGDGIGPEITDATLMVLDATGCEFAWDRQTAGAGAIERRGDPLPDPVLESIHATKCALKGPLETPVGGGYRSVNVALRKEFQLYANLRPVRTIVPFRGYTDIDLILVRENTQGLYAGVEHFVQVGEDPKAVAESTAIVTREGCSQIVKFAFEYALHHGREKVTLVHKANILKMVSGLFLEEGRRVAEQYKGRIESDDKIIDNCAMQLVMKPEQFDVIVTTNMFGDILSDQMAGLIGGLGLAPSANIGHKASIFEAVHGTAPDIAGQGKANPSALILSAAMMLEHLGEMDAGRRVREGVVETIKAGHKTGDLGGTMSTMDFAKAVVERVQ